MLLWQFGNCEILFILEKNLHKRRQEIRCPAKSIKLDSAAINQLQFPKVTFVLDMPRFCPINVLQSQ